MTISREFSIDWQPQKTRRWLSDISNSPDIGNYLQDLILCIMGIYLCDRLENKSDHPRAKQALSALSHHLEKFDMELAKEKIGAVRLLLSYKILWFYGLDPGILLKISKEYAGLFKKIGSPVPMEYTAIQMFLYDMELIDTKPGARIINSKDIYHEPLEILSASKEKLVEICELINTASLYGTASVPGQPGYCAELIGLLMPVMFQRFRVNDLEPGLMILRSLNYLGLKDKVILDNVLDFLPGQQRNNGSFGYQPRGSKFISQKEVLTRNLYLLNTISCLWSIAEIVVPGFRLFALFKEKGEKRKG